MLGQLRSCWGLILTLCSDCLHQGWADGWAKEKILFLSLPGNVSLGTSSLLGAAVWSLALRPSHPSPKPLERCRQGFPLSQVSPGDQEHQDPQTFLRGPSVVGCSPEQAKGLCGRENAALWGSSSWEGQRGAGATPGEAAAL